MIMFWRKILGPYLNCFGSADVSSVFLPNVGSKQLDYMLS